MTFILSIVVALVLVFAPTLISVVRCSYKEISTVFLLNICWLLASFVQPVYYTNMNWMGWVGNILMLLAFIMLIPEEKEVDIIS